MTDDTALYTLTITVTMENGRLVANRVLTKNGQSASELTFTNTYERITSPDKTVVSGTKTWHHGNNAEEKRPKYIIVYIYADGEIYAQRQVTAQSDWVYVFELPKYAKVGHEIVYTVSEAPIRDYESEVEGYNLVNTYTPGINPDAPDYSDSPQTGDSSRFVLWIVLMVLSTVGLVCTAILIKRTRFKVKD